MRKGLLSFGLVLVVIGIAVVCTPFGRPALRQPGAASGWVSTASRCRAPLISAWQRDPDAGWFGYAPLTSTAADAHARFPTCEPRARRRLAGGGLVLLIGVAVGVVAWRRPRDPEPVVDDSA